MEYDKDGPGNTFTVIVWVLVALVPALWFWKRPVKFLAFIMIQIGILVLFLFYPLVGAIYYLSYSLLVHSVKGRI